MDTISVEIKPEPAVCGKTIGLNPIDQIAPRNHTVFYWFFKINQGADKQRIAKSIQKGFIHAIAEIPQAMCSVARGDASREELKLVYEAAGGAAFYVKDYTTSSLSSKWRHGSFDELESQHFPLSKLDPRLTQGPISVSETDNTRCAVLQVNFIEGGMVLNLMLHHLMCDGSGMNLFVNTLSRHTASQYTGETATQVPTISFTERHTVIPPLQQEVRLNEFPDWKLVSVVAQAPEAAAPARLSSAECQTKHSVYFISRQNLSRLRTKLTTPDFQPSRMEALSALLWVSTVRARGVDVNHYPEAKLSVAVDTRAYMSNLNSAVGPSYWGNMSEPNAVARLPTKYMLREKSSTADQAATWVTVLPTAAKRVRESINAVDSKAVQRLTALLNQMPKTTSLTWNVDRWPGPDMLICCLNLFGFNNVDLGPEIGKSKAFRVTIGEAGTPDGRCLVLPPRPGDDGGLEILLQYDTETLERLRQDADFAQFCKWRN